MRAYVLTDTKTPPELTDLPVPTPNDHQVLVKIAACGLNFADLLMMKGSYQEKPDLPAVMGLELAGTIEAIGDKISGLRIGQRVAVFGGQGGLAEYGVFPAERCTPLPDALSFPEAAAAQVAYGTSHLALDHLAKTQPGDVVLVLGASGGVGLTAVEIAAQMGATVIACARGADKLKIAQDAGAHHLLDSDDPELRQKVKALGGADVVYDPIGEPLFSRALRSCKPGARYLIIGFAGGTVPQIPANYLLVKNISVLGLYWGGYLKFAPETLTSSMAQLFEWLAEGKLKPHISHQLPLDQVQDGLELLRNRKSTGKIVITP